MADIYIGNVKGPQGATGATGAQGPQGDAATIEVGTVSTTAYGNTAQVINTGTSSEAVFDFVIPQGRPGEETTQMSALTLDTVTAQSAQYPIPATGETGAVVFGKIIKFFNDIKTATTQNLTYDGKKVFLIVREGKTQKINKIPLHLLFDGKAIAIIDKYKTENRATIFPSASDQAINRNIKAIAQSVGINKEVSFHCSRHTFGSLLAQFTHDPLLIKNLMNHSDIHTSLRYIHEAEDERERKLQNVDWNF